ncbi:MAG: hypothetical protein QXI33_01635 [Candidatus Pacearchaeota archaeon]
MTKKRGVYRLILMFLVFMLVVFIPFVISFQGFSSNYTMESRPDSFSQTNSSSTTFIQRFVGGIGVVGRYISDTLSGRFGILEDIKNLAITITSHTDNQEIVRGNDSVAEEDTKGYIPNSLNFTAQVHENGTSAGFSLATCYFYDNGIFIGSSLTNTSGHCTMNFSKLGYNPDIRNVTVNFSILTSDKIVINEATINISIVKFIADLEQINKRSNGKYYSGDKAILTINITKTNVSGTFDYDPMNISANATSAALVLYPDGELYYPGRNISRISTGRYQGNVTLNYSFANALRWDVLVSDDNFINFLATSIHSDVDVCSADFGAFSGWSECSNGLQTRSRTDSSGCIEVEIRGCSEGGGGGGICIPSWSNWSNWSSCYLGQETRSRFDGCGSSETQFRECGCTPNWQCGPWSGCIAPNTQLSYNSGLNDGFETSNLLLEMSQEQNRIPVKIEVLSKNQIDKKNSELKIDEKLINANYVFVDNQKNILDNFNKIKNIFSSKITGFATLTSCSVESDIGNKRCHLVKKNIYQECTQTIKRNKLTLNWKNYRCKSGLICVGDGECACTQLNSCEIEGALRCTGAGTFQVCQSDNNGCLKWSSNKRCSRGEICSNGLCVSGKSGESKICELNDETCINNRIYTCKTDSKGVNKWVAGERCSIGSTCVDYGNNSECVLDHCFDNIKNFDETDVDCGGSNCLACISLCGNNLTELNEICDGNSKSCEVGGYSGIQECNSLCNGFNECVLNERCGDGVIQTGAGEECDDGNSLSADGCSILCKNETLQLPEDNNQTIKNESEITLSPDQVLVGIGEIVQLTIFKGEDISVTYEERFGDKVLLRIRTSSYSIILNNVIEVHTLTVNEIKNGSIVVTINSEPITKEIEVGGTKIFSFNLPSGEQWSGENSGGSSGSGSVGSYGSSGGSGGIFGGGQDSGINLSPPPDYPYQTRTCIDLNQCGTDEGKPPEVQQCILGLSIEYSPQNLNLNILNKSSINFSVNVSGAGTNLVEVKWYYDGVFQSGNSGVGSLSSKYTKLFDKDSIVRADILSGGGTQSILWRIKIVQGLLNCEENWYCRWTSCANETYRYSYDCIDLNQCGTNVNLPIFELCTCTPELICTEFGDCQVNYDYSDVLKGIPILSAFQEQQCVDKSICEEESFINRKECSLSKEFRTIKTEWCYQTFIEIYDAETDKLVARYKEGSSNGLLRVDIGFVTSDYRGVCAYCFDKIKNFDETDVDCGGPNCPACIEGIAYFDYLPYIISLLWLLLLLLIIMLLYMRKALYEVSPLTGLVRILRRREAPETPETKERRVSKKPFSERFRSLVPKLRLPSISIKIRIEKSVSRIKERARLRKEEKTWVRKRIERPIYRMPIPFADLRRKLSEWRRKAYYSTVDLERKLNEAIENTITKLKKSREKRREEKRIIKIKKKEFRKERRRARKEIRHIKRRIRKKQISKHEISDLRRKLNEWKSKGYYDTTGLQKKLDEYEGHNPLK